MRQDVFHVSKMPTEPQGVGDGNKKGKGGIEGYKDPQVYSQFDALVSMPLEVKYSFDANKFRPLLITQK